MNRKVFVSMLALCVSFLAGCYFLKIFFPQEFAMQITNEKFVLVGNFVDSHILLKMVCTFLTSFLTYFLYICAVCERKTINIKQTIIIALVIIGSIIVEKFAINFLTIYSICSMFGLPLIFNADFKKTYIVFSVHGISQVLSLGIRGFAENIYTFNFAIGFLMTLECYLWLALFYVLFNFYKEKEK